MSKVADARSFDQRSEEELMLVERILAKYRVHDADAIVSTLALSIERQRAEAQLPKNQMKLVPTPLHPAAT